MPTQYEGDTRVWKKSAGKKYIFATHRCISGCVQVFIDYELLAYGLVHQHEGIYLQYATFLHWKEL